MAGGEFRLGDAITSLCFVDAPRRALAEAWRVGQRGVALGLLNRRSALYRQKHGRGAYAGARWDTPAEVRGWIAELTPLRTPRVYACDLPAAWRTDRAAERSIAAVAAQSDGFLAVVLEKPSK